MSEELRLAVETDQYEFVDCGEAVDVSDAYADYQSSEEFD